MIRMLYFGVLVCAMFGFGLLFEANLVFVQGDSFARATSTLE